MVLLRLRKLIVVQDAIIVREESVSLNSTKVWVDAYALEKGVGGCMEVGVFLPSDQDELWTVPKRERLRVAQLRHGIDIGRRLEFEEKWSNALDHYLRGIESEELAEGLYEGALSCYLRLHRPAEGMILLRRLRHLLSVVLGMAPSPVIGALAGELRTLQGKVEEISDR